MYSMRNLHESVHKEEKRLFSQGSGSASNRKSEYDKRVPSLYVTNIAVVLQIQLKK